MSKHFFQTLLSHRWKVLGLLILLVAPFSPFLARVRLDLSIERYYSRDKNTQNQYERFKKEFKRQDDLVYLFFKEQPFTWESYRTLKALQKELERAGLQEVSWFATTIPALAFETKEAFDAQKIRTASTFYDGILWNKKRTTFLLSGYLPPGFDHKKLPALNTRLTESLKPHKRPGRTMLLSGTPIITTRYMQFMQRDQTLFIGSSVLILLVTLFIIMGSLKGVLLFFLSVLPAWILIAGGMAALGRPLSALLSVLPIILLIVGISDSIHILTPLRESKKSHDQAIVDAFSALWLSCFLTSLTTALGFFSLTFTGIPVVIEFGAVTAAGIMLTYLFSMTLFPLLLAWFPLKKSARFEELLAKGIATIPRFVRRHKRVIVSGTALALALLFFFFRGITVDTYMVDDLKPSHPISRSIKWIDQEGFGVFQLNLLMEPHSHAQLSSKESRAWMERFARTMGKSPLVKKIVTPHHVMAAVEDQLGVALGDYTLFLKTQIGAKTFAPVYNIKSKTAQMIVFIHDVGTKRTKHLVGAMRSWLKANPPPFKVYITGTTMVAQSSFDQVISGFSRSLLWAVLFIFAVLLFVSRSIKVSLLLLIPNVVPLLSILGIMGAFAMRVSPSTALVFSISLGIIVDNSIHLFGAVHKRKKEGASLSRAVDGALVTTGRAIATSSLIIISGFLGMLFSGYRAINNMGLFVAGALILSFFANLVLLPALLPQEKTKQK